MNHGIHRTHGREFQPRKVTKVARMEKQDLIIYKTEDGRTSVALTARDGMIWLNQSQLAELFATSTDFLTTAADGKNYTVRHYALPNPRFGKTVLSEGARSTCSLQRLRCHRQSDPDVFCGNPEQIALCGEPLNTWERIFSHQKAQKVTKKRDEQSPVKKSSRTALP
jgi:hypothetical protein